MHYFIHGLTEMFVDCFSKKTGIQLYSPEKRRADKLWKFVMSLFFLFGLLPIYIVDKTFENSDLLSKETAVRSYYHANIIAMVLITLEFMVWVIVLYIGTQKRPNTAMKALSFIFSFIFIVGMGIHYVMAASNIDDDLRHPAVTVPEKYVICTDKNGEHYYIGFEEKGEFPMLEIPRDDYEKLRKAYEPEKNTAGVEVYSMIRDGGYEELALYNNTGVEVTYYFNSAVFIGIKI